MSRGVLVAYSASVSIIALPSAPTTANGSLQRCYSRPADEICRTIRRRKSVRSPRVFGRLMDGSPKSMFVLHSTISRMI